MFIHIGKREIVSDSVLVGIFNRETMERSEQNIHYLRNLSKDVKSIVIDKNNSVIGSIISSYTIIKRKNMTEGIAWRRKDDQRI
mgnify:CR=1 FL=1